MQSRLMGTSQLAIPAVLFLCLAGPIKIFAPIALIVIGLIVLLDKDHEFGPQSIFAFSILFALVVFYGIQRQDDEHVKIAYRAHRHSIHCLEVDKWYYGAAKPAGLSKARLVREEERCGEPDLIGYRLFLEEKGW